MSKIARFCLFTLLPVALFAQSAKPPRRTILPEAVREVSGMTRTPDGSLWLLNDSRNPPELFRYDPLGGRLLETRRLPVANRDWEDLAHDTAGNLYIGDFGSNRNARRNLRVYRYNPVNGALDSILFRYPDQGAFPPADERDWNFNCEAMVWYRDSLHLFSKNSFKGNFYTKHYVLPAKPGEYVAELRETLRLRNRVVTGATLSDDGRTLALTAYIVRKKWGFLPHTQADVFFFTDFSNSNFLKGKRSRKRLPKFFISRQFESVAPWGDKYWLVANERQASQKPSVWRLKR